jgi:GT2 family glycosyltransferase
VLNTLLEEEVNDKVLGTSGCIYRVKAIRQVGGFNPNFKGVGEDMDAENRIQEAGWKLYISPAVFYETRRQSWRALWDEYFWHGKGGNHLFRENKHAISFKIFPLVAFATKLFQISIAYRLTRRKSVILLPLHYAFKRIAWLFGLLKGLLEKEGIES